MQRLANTAFVILFFVFVYPALSFAFSTDGGGHLTITDNAIALEKQKKSSDELFAEWIRIAVQGGPNSLVGNFLTGVRDEDCTPVNPTAIQELPIDGKWPIGPNGWGNFFEHFFNPRTGAGLWSNRTAIARAEEYERKIKSLICSSSSRYDELNELSRKKVNDYFGRLFHLLQDMGMSYHTKLEIHPFQVNKPLEHYVETNWETIKASDLFKEELLNTNCSTGKCIDPTVPMFRLAQWSNDLPPSHSYWELVDFPSDDYELLNDMVAHYATRMSARATKFTEGYIDQIWRAINSDCICEPPISGPGRDHPDDTFTMSGSFLGATQLNLSASDQLDFFMRLALKKGDMSPVYTKQLKDIYAEAQALPPTASQETRDEIQARFQAFLNFLNSLPARDREEWPDIALLENGFHEKALALFSKAREPVRLISSDFAPSLLQSQPILVIPSGGLAGLDKSTFFKASLDEYVKNGGTLIVFGQQQGYEFSALPVPDEPDGTKKLITGYGWNEDQNCFTNAVYINTYHQMLSGQSRTTPTLNMDGYFSGYPSTATVLLTRTANGQPAMFMYDYGQGKVIVTSMYSDFAFGHSQASPEEIALARDMIAWAKKPASIPEIKRGEAVSLTLDVANHKDTDAAAVKLLIFNPDRSVRLLEQVVSGGVPAHGATQIAVQYNAPTNAQLGVYHVDYALLDTQGITIQPQTEVDSGRFTVSNPPKTGTPDKPIWFSVTTPSQDVLRGDLMHYTFRIYNNTDQTRSLTIKSIFGHTGRPHTWSVTAGPMGETTVSSSDIYTDSFYFETMDARLYDEASQEISRYQLTFRGRGEYQYIEGRIAAVTTDKPIYARNESVRIRVSYQNPMSTPLHATLTTAICDTNTDPYCQGMPILKDERMVTAAGGGTTDFEVVLALPPSVRTGFYTVTVFWRSAYGTAMPNRCTFQLPASQIVVRPSLEQPLVAGVNATPFILTNAGSIPVSTGILGVVLRDPGGTTISSSSHPFALLTGHTLTLDVPVEVQIPTLGTYTLSYTQSDETKTGRAVSVPIPNTAILTVGLDKPIFKARETASIVATVTNTGKFNLENLQVTANIPDMAYSQTQTVTIPSGQANAASFSALLPGSIASGSHDVNITLTSPSGSSLTQTARFSVPESQLVISHPGPQSVRAGDTISLMIRNTGGVDAAISGGTITARDFRGTRLAQASLPSADVRVGEEISLGTIQIPQQSMAGEVNISAAVTEAQTQQTSNFDRRITVDGVLAGLVARTNRDAYTDGEPIQSTTTITTNATFGVIDANLDLAVYKINSATDGSFKHFLPSGWLPHIYDWTEVLIAGSSDGFVNFFWEGRILKYDIDGNLITQWGSSGSEDGQFFEPCSMAGGPDGFLYVADTGNYRIQKFDRNGNFIAKWGTYGTGDGQFDLLRGIAVDQGGFVYAIDLYRIQKFDSNGNFITKWGSYSYSCDNPGGFVDPNGIAVGNDGYVYVKDAHCGAIQKFDGNGAFITKWGSEGEGDGQFSWDGSSRGNNIVVGPDGYVYASDYWNHRIQKFDSNGAFAAKWGTLGFDPGKFYTPRALTFDTQGNLYVTEDFGNAGIQKFDSNGTFLVMWQNEGEVREPYAITLTRDGSVLIGGPSYVKKYDRDGAFLETLVEDLNYFFPRGIATGPDGSVYAISHYFSEIRKISGEGDFYIGPGTGDGQVQYPWGLVSAADGSIYIADTDNNRIQQVDRNGTFLRKWGSQGSGDGQFEFPKGIAVAPDGAVYVADTLNNRIQKFDGNGNFITKWGSQGYADGQFVEPVAVASGLDGSVFVASDSRVQSFDSQGVFIKRWGRVPEIGPSFAFTVFGEGGSTGMSGEINFNSPSGIAIGPEGSVYVADTGNNHIQKLGNSSVETFFTATIPITQPANTTHGYTNDIGALGSTGKFFLEATLTNSLGQRLGRSTYPFYVVPENMFAIFSTDKAMYRPGETVTIQGEARNLSSVAANGVSFVMTRESAAGSETLYGAAFDVPANGAYPFTISTSAGSEGTFMLTGTITHLSAAVFEATDRYEVTTPKASATVTGPDAAGSDPFTLTFAITNEGKIDIAVVFTSPFDSQTLSIPAGESRILVYPPQQITQDTTYTFTLSGDVNMAVSKTVGYGLAASLTANVLPMYPEGNVAIPLSVNNGGSLDGSFTVDVLLQPSGLSSQRNYAIPHGQTISDTLLFNLAEGDYTLSLASQSPPTSTSVSFFVRKETKATMAAITMGAPVGGLIPVSTEVVNGGAVDIEGTAQMSIVDTQAAVVWQANQAMSIPASSTPTPAPVSFSFSPAVLPPGAYTVMVALLNNGGQELASRNMPLTITGSNVRLTQMPSFQTGNAGEEATFIFKVANTGGRDGSAELTLKSGDFINLTRRELINPGEEKEFPFAFSIPYDLETKDYFAEYELKSEGVSIAKGQVRYHVAGITINVGASLDKDHYREGETAHLSLVVSQAGANTTRSLFARVNYGDYDGKESFSLTGSQNLSFNVPLTSITGEKLFYGIYEEGGRSIHLNSLYIYRTGDVLTITTNKQVYSQGETVVAAVTGTSAGTLTLSAPGGYEETFPFNGSASRSFTLPLIATAGTYYIEAQLTLLTGETVTANKPFDIAGISVKVKETALDKGKYLPGDTLRFSMRIESNSDMPAILKVWTVDPDKNSTFLGERQLSLTRAEQAIVSADYPATITTSGIHKVVYGIYSDRLLLSSGNLSFDAGAGVILGIATDRNEYPLGSEAVAVRLNLYGTIEATLTLNVNGAAVHTETVSLNGFTTPAIQLPMPGPGAHTLEGILTVGGLASKKETKFLYGTNLPDLAADVWGSGTSFGKDGTMKLIATAGNRGKTNTSPTSMTLHDSDTLLATFAVGEIVSGANQSFEYSWNVLGKAGEHTLAATVDPQNALTEFTKENNRVTRRIVVPDIALITETDKENYRAGEQVTINATAINLTAATNYPNLTCTTTVRDPAGAEVYRQSSAFGLPPSQSALTSVIWNTGSVTTEGRYTIRQEISSGTDLLAEKTKTVNITAGSGFGLRVEPATLRIKQGETALFTVSVDSCAGCNRNVTLEAEGIPTGTTATFAPGIVSAPGNSILSITSSDSTPPGTYPLTLIAQGEGNGGIIVQTVPVTLAVSGFNLQAEPESIAITQQETAHFVIKAESLNGYEGRSLSLSNTTAMTQGLVVTIMNTSLPVPGEVSVRIESSNDTIPGSYIIEISASDGFTTRKVGLPVNVSENMEIKPGFVITPGPGYDNRALVALVSRNFVEQIEFTAFNTRFGANAVMGDIDGDGEDEIIVAPGPDPSADGRVRIFRKNGVMLLDQPVFTTKFGATLATGDIDGDGRKEVVVGAGPGLTNTARVKVLTFDGQRLADTGIDFVAFPNLYKLGVKLALGDVDGDGILEIIAGAGPSLLNPARIRVFKIDTSGGTGRWKVASTLSDFVVNFGDWYPYFFGVNVAAGDVDGDGKAEIIAGAGPNPLQKAIVAIYKGNGKFTGKRFEAYPANGYRFGANVAVRDLDGDGIAEIITGPGPSPFSASWVRVFKGDGTLLSDGFMAFPKVMKFGAKVSMGNVGE